MQLLECAGLGEQGALPQIDSPNGAGLLPSKQVEQRPGVKLGLGGH
jgi:hypothetical protein